MNRNLIEIPIYVVVSIDRNSSHVEVMAVFTSRDDAYMYVEHYTYTERDMMVFTSVLNPQIH
jgi:hypothetical protein